MARSVFDLASIQKQPLKFLLIFTSISFFLYYLFAISKKLLLLLSLSDFFSNLTILLGKTFNFIRLEQLVFDLHTVFSICF